MFIWNLSIKDDIFYGTHLQTVKFLDHAIANKIITSDNARKLTFLTVLDSIHATLI